MQRILGGSNLQSDRVSYLPTSLKDINLTTLHDEHYHNNDPVNGVNTNSSI